jgi:hypothetical protein
VTNCRDQPFISDALSKLSLEDCLEKSTRKGYPDDLTSGAKEVGHSCCDCNVSSRDRVDESAEGRRSAYTHSLVCLDTHARRVQVRILDTANPEGMTAMYVTQSGVLGVNKDSHASPNTITIEQAKL